MMRFATTTALLAAMALVLLPQSAVAQFVPPDEGGDSGYAPPPPPPPAPTPTTTSTSTAPSGDRPLSYSERMKLKQEQERQEREAKKAEDTTSTTAAGGAAIAGPRVQTRPTDFSIGFGAGWIWSGWTLRLADPNLSPGPDTYVGPAAGSGTDILTPNTASARIRFGESVALEPGILIGLGNARDVVDLSNGSDFDTLDKVDAQSVIIDLAIRYGFMHRASTSAILIFGAGFGVNAAAVDPEGANNITQVLNMMVNLNFGLGVEWFITPHFALSGDMVSPLVSVRSAQFKDENPDPEIRTNTSSLDLALNFQPGARLMFHVYY